MSIVTKKGDGGTTQLFSGERVSKADARLELAGIVDELIAALGVARSFSPREELSLEIRSLQTNLMRLATEFSCAGSRAPSGLKKPITSSDISTLDANIREMESKIILPASFLVPGTTPCASFLELSRTIARRLERAAIAVRDEKGHVTNEVVIFLNRLSDYLFMLARHAELLAGVPFDCAG